MAKVTELKINLFPSLYKRICWSFGLLTFAIFVLYWSVIYIAEEQLEVISLHHWLDTIATKYQRDYEVFGSDAALPDSNEFISYWDLQGLPTWLQAYQQPGFYEHLLGSEDKHFKIVPHPSGQGFFYIVFKDDADDYLDHYEKQLHLFMISVGVITTLLMLLYGFYLTRAISKPLDEIQRKISLMPPGNALFSIDSAYSESREIEFALLQSKMDIAKYFQREQEFTRFSSHEMRTAIMVIKGSTELLKKMPNESKVARKALTRLDFACDDLTILTDTFLLLGRKVLSSHHLQSCQLELLLRRQLNEMELIFNKQLIHYELMIDNTLLILAPESFLVVIINNLMKNALDYSTGEISIRLINQTLTVSNPYDSQIGINAGYGCGLIIVERICERMNWQINITDSGSEFHAEIDFGLTPSSAINSMIERADDGRERD
ncbi:HAMP domain-containing histidine kinase [Moritella sp. 24]|uniref:sensor histidine kinase n=1 Tax=Moritella sp. 24 TaxID=2746230 RepID=UPI001BA6E523|nr:HAMP domain-containing sensor histidine kinase [Moritella sp. 24]QUM74871.1 HAMP domain-containing histidine kinase [Moritella sp. 24]